nr:uncharacterized protein LOC113817296 [Penaeus vannamei]
MNDERLIVLVRNHPVLYDLSEPKYMDSGLKQRIWKNIGQELKVDSTLCKGRWNNIRDNYRKSLKKTSAKRGQSAKKKIYKYSEQLSFLKKYIYERKPKGYIASQQDEESDQDDDAQQLEKDEADVAYGAQGLAVTDVSLHEDFRAQPSPAPKPTPEASGKSANKKVAPQQTASAISLEEYLISKQKKQTLSTSPHPVDAFLAGIAPTLKTLTPYYLNVAKSEIFATVQKYELQMLTNQHPREEKNEPSASVSSA